MGHITTEIYLEEGTINFSGQLRIGIDLAIDFDLVLRRICTPKYNENIEGGLSSK